MRSRILVFCIALLVLIVSTFVDLQGQASPIGSPASGQGEASKNVAKVSPPHSIYSPDPEYSEEARRAKYQGTCVVSLTVGADGLPHGIRVVRHLGMGLDENAVATVRTWKWEPASKDDERVEVQIEVKVRFRLHGAGTDKIAKLWDRSDANDAKADLELSKAYLKGRDVPKDGQLGLQFLKMAADWNLPEAQFQMGEQFYKDQTGSPDYVSAYMWYALAKRGGAKGSEQMLKVMASKMSAEQLSEAETRVDYWPEVPPK
jgi:TonB family protein